MEGPMPGSRYRDYLYRGYKIVRCGEAPAGKACALYSPASELLIPASIIQQGRCSTHFPECIHGLSRDWLELVIDGLVPEGK